MAHLEQTTGQRPTHQGVLREGLALIMAGWTDPEAATGYQLTPEQLAGIRGHEAKQAKAEAERVMRKHKRDHTGPWKRL
jgi:hypothetical protein